MKQSGIVLRAAIGLAVLLAAASCRSSHDLATPQGQAGFGVEMAKMNLWREAMFRFQRAIALNPNDAQAYNNLAVAYEANGDSENAAKAYREAMRLDKSNQYIQKNYSRYVEFTSRNKKRQAKDAAAAGTETATPKPATDVPSTPASPPVDVPATGPASAPAPIPAPGPQRPTVPTAPPVPPVAPAPAATPAGGSL